MGGRGGGIFRILFLQVAKAYSTAPIMLYEKEKFRSLALAMQPELELILFGPWCPIWRETLAAEIYLDKTYRECGKEEEVYADKGRGKYLLR